MTHAARPASGTTCDEGGDPSIGASEQLGAATAVNARDDLLRYAARLSGDRTVVEDVVQDAYVRFFGQKIAVAHPISYLKRIVANLLTDHARSRRRRPLDVALDDATEVADNRPSPFQLLAGRDAIRRFGQVLGRLPVRTQQVFMMSRVDGLSYAEIATHLGISIKAVEKHMSRAIAHFDRSMGDIL